MTHQEIREKFRNFMESHGHTWVASSSLLPDDPSVLFTTAGMQQFKPYYTNPAMAPAKNVASIQKCVRTSDIDEVGDESHLTFFEMLGNFSFGGYFKDEAIRLAYDFITREMGLTIDYVSVFGGEDTVPADDDSERIWKALDPSIEVRKAGRADNFWGPTGDEGPCGPTTEVYVNGIEIWNIVFNQYFQTKEKELRLLETPGIDTGMGLERLAMVVQGKANIYETDLFPNHPTDRAGRIIADHSRAIVALIAEGLEPSNKDRGYVLRRLIRRIVTLEYMAGRSDVDLGPVYEQEKQKFLKTLGTGIKELGRVAEVDAAVAFRLYESYGLPYEVIKDIAGARAGSLTRGAFDEKFKEHQAKSRAGAEKKFGGHGLLLDTGELKAGNPEELQKVTRLHTATHLLHAALREVLGTEVHQAGSDITPERTRFDFTFPRKLTDEEKAAVEEIVNDAIKRDLAVNMVTLPKQEAEGTGALFFFKEKYPDPVNVYYVGPDMLNAFSKEFCGGPHVTHTGEIGRFTITKEESVSAGVRRIRAVIS
ncbi:MAG TPA: alanine--tRNA ligase-related protein [Candidatus Paceibacterota bacterium]|nr:alanine--tRNA ligase-related protein [Candidatus Paceibacterota bacterium]